MGDTVTQQHAISVIVLIDGRYRAMCSCNGLRGTTSMRQLAEIQAEQHLAYVAEVEALKRAYPSGGEGER